MKIIDFLKAILPFWLTMLVLTILFYFYGAEYTVIIKIILRILSYVLLPLFVGFFVVRSGGGVKFAIIGGVSISSAMILAVAIGDLIASSDFSTLYVFFVATLVYAVAPQAIFGALGGFVARRIFVKGT